VVHKLIPGLEKHRNAELAERKEKRKKQHGSEKENEKDNKEEKERSNNAECTRKYYCNIIQVLGKIKHIDFEAYLFHISLEIRKPIHIFATN